MSVINSMLRDLDRRHAPLPVNARVQPTPARKHSTWPRSAVALCALIILVIWSWNHHSKPTTAKAVTAPITNSMSPPPAKAVTEILQPQTTAQSGDPHSSPQPASKPDEQPSVVSTTLAVAASEDAKSLTPKTDSGREHHSAEKPARKIIAAEKITEQAAVQESAPVVKQERPNPNALNDERYQLARAALAQNQPQRAYELLRDDPPPLAAAIDYHAVLAAVEQQLGHYADASLRYQQLLQIDPNQASWWLGLALALEGEHRGADALAAYQRAATLNTLPVAAQQYAAARIAVLGSTTNTAGVER